MARAFSHVQSYCFLSSCERRWYFGAIVYQTLPSRLFVYLSYFSNFPVLLVFKWLSRFIKLRFRYDDSITGVKIVRGVPIQEGRGAWEEGDEQLVSPKRVSDILARRRKKGGGRPLVAVAWAFLVKVGLITEWFNDLLYLVLSVGDMGHWVYELVAKLTFLCIWRYPPN
jgi:hypothetical protein